MTRMYTTGRRRKGWSVNPADSKQHGGDVGSWRPTWQQELLLRAALRGEKEAINAWHEWHASMDTNRLDAGSYSLLPMVYRNLRAQAETVPDLGRLKGNYRYTW